MPSLDEKTRRPVVLRREDVREFSKRNTNRTEIRRLHRQRVIEGSNIVGDRGNSSYTGFKRSSDGGNKLKLNLEIIQSDIEDLKIILNAATDIRKTYCFRR